MSADPELRDRIAGVLLGTAAGDALGLPREGLTARRAARIFGSAPLGHRFIFGRGMLSDDTEHACMVAQAFLASGGEPRRFARSLAWRLRLWLLGLPAGIGLATVRGILKLWVGFPPHVSGVRSQGNGPAMRSGLLGLLTEGEVLHDLVNAATRVTHRDPVAEQGALAVALACAYASKRDPADIRPAEVHGLLRDELSDPALLEALNGSERALADGQTGREWAEGLELRKGVSGWMLRTMPAALLCWLRHPSDYRAAVEEVILLGGDTDTTGAITGALAGASVGASGIPAELLSGIVEYPRSVAWIGRLADRVSDHLDRPEVRTRTQPLFWPVLLPRNLVFLLVVLAHGFRRILPPY